VFFIWLSAKPSLPSAQKKRSAKPPALGKEADSGSEGRQMAGLLVGFTKGGMWSARSRMHRQATHGYACKLAGFDSGLGQGPLACWHIHYYYQDLLKMIRYMTENIMIM
jgi:hypothetical protein